MSAKNLRQAGVSLDRSSVTIRPRKTPSGTTAASMIEDLSAALPASPRRRDFNLVREILLTAEQPGPPLFSYPEFGPDLVQHHLVLMMEAGLLHGTTLREGGGTTRVLVERLSWSGHDLLALVRNSADWQKARAKILDANGRADFPVLTSWLRSQATP